MASHCVCKIISSPCHALKGPCPVTCLPLFRSFLQFHDPCSALTPRLPHSEASALMWEPLLYFISRRSSLGLFRKVSPTMLFQSPASQHASPICTSTLSLFIPLSYCICLCRALTSCLHVLVSCLTPPIKCNFCYDKDLLLSCYPQHLEECLIGHRP